MSEEYTCPLCGAEGVEITEMGDAQRRYVCNKCGTRWLGPSIEDVWEELQLIIRLITMRGEP